MPTRNGGNRAYSKTILKGAAAASVTFLVAAPLLANHSWNNYHWARSGAQLTMEIGDNVSSQWDSYYQVAVSDWNRSNVIEARPVAGRTNPRNCRAVSGRIEVCNSSYGQTGWLGIAQIWLANGHITQGITKLNDTYFNTAKYNTPAWRALVTCQEIGHDFGLGHQDEDFATDATTSCMDYTNVPQGNEHPDQHDYGQLESIYQHSDGSSSSTQSPGQSEGAGGNTPAEWGRPVDFTADGRPHVFEKVVAPGRRMITHVFWAEGEGPRGQHH
jgi:hypothetical protein